MKRLLIAGFGDLGQRLTAKLIAEPGWDIHVLRRSTVKSSNGITVHQADLTRPETLQALPDHFDGVVYQATPDERTPAAYRKTYLQGLENLLARTRFDQLVMVSSTAVYGQNQGQWVDEHSTTAPDTFNGQILLEAEQQALAAGGQVVRFSGIYGPGRERLIKSVRDGQASCSTTITQWTNRIHADDAAAVLAHLLRRPELGPVICASDDQPSPRREVLDWLAEQMEVPRPGSDGPAEPALTDPVASGKRVCNHELRASGYEFTYPDFRSGYAALLRELVEDD